jgi:5-methylcytosine-specific restriction endonuclease McrA
MSPCIICGNPLPPRRRSYCSDSCRDERWHREIVARIEEGKQCVGYRPMMWPSIAAEQVRLYPVCSRCGSTKYLEAHHIRPLHSGGSNGLSNLTTLCHDCHRAQHRSKPRKHDSTRTLQGALP